MRVVSSYAMFLTADGLSVCGRPQAASPSAEGDLAKGENRPFAHTWSGLLTLFVCRDWQMSADISSLDICLINR